MFKLRLSAFSHVLEGISCYKPLLILIGTVWITVQYPNRVVFLGGAKEMVLGIVFLFGGSKSQCLGGIFI